MSVIHSNILVCVDCLYVQANGVECEEHAEAARLMAERWPYPTYIITNNCSDDCEGEFSWQPCEGCGSPLGGDRHPMVVWDETVPTPPTTPESLAAAGLCSCGEQGACGVCHARRADTVMTLAERMAYDPADDREPGCGCGCSNPYCQV